MMYGDAIQVGKMPDQAAMAQPTQSTPLREAMGKHVALLDVLPDLIGKLESRLSIVLRPVPPEPTGAGKEAGIGGPVSPMTAAMEKENERLSDSLRRIDSLIGRIDL